MGSTKFYRIKQGTETHKKLENSHEHKMKFRAFMNDFLTKNGLETDRFYISSSLMLEPTDADLEKFRNQIKADNKSFKKTSMLNKEYQKGLSDNEISTQLARGLSTWDYGAYLTSGGTYQTFLNKSSNTFYLSISPKYDEAYNVIDDVEEIKGSEYYAAYENR